MRSVSVVAACAAIMALAAVAAADEAPLKLGALYNITGELASVEGPASLGSLLAAKLINEKGGLPGGRQLKLILIDTKTKRPLCLKSAHRLVSTPVSAGLGFCDSDPVLVAAPVFQEAGIPFLTVGATDPGLPKKIGSFMFMTPFGDDDQGHAMAEFAYKDVKARSMALWINQSTDFTRVLAGFFKERYLALGGNIVEERSFRRETKDYSALIASLKKLSTPPDAIFISGNPMDAKPSITQLRRAGIKIPILSGDGFDVNLLEVLPKPEDANGVCFATHTFLSSNRPEVVAFVGAYTREYGTPPRNSFAALGFDAVNLIADATTRAGSADPKAIAKALAETRGFKGVTGDISFTRPSRVPVVPVSIVGIENGKYRLLTTWTP